EIYNFIAFYLVLKLIFSFLGNFSNNSDYKVFVDV
ncbi:unnamed protein product, partial [marine sediment metagenome]